MNDFSKLKIYANLANDAYSSRKIGDKIQNYEVIDTFNFIGFQSTLYKSVDNKKILGIRGTEVEISINSLSDLYNDLQLALAGVNLQELDLERYYNKLIAQGIISPNEKITVVGHSLGGYLAQILTLKHPEVVNNTYTFNAPGIGGLPGTLLNALGIENFYNPKITDVVAKDGLSLIAGTGLNAGQEIEVSGETHFIAPMTKILYFYDEMIKNGVSEKDITNYLSGFYQIPSKIFDNKKSVEHIANKTLNAINKIVNGDNTRQKDIIDIAIDFEKNNTKFSIEFIFSNGFNQSTFPNSSIPTPALYALVHLNPFIVSGVDSPAYKELEKYKDEYSDNYIQDRIKMFDHFMHNVTDVGSYFYDMQSGVSHGITDGANHGTSDNTNPYIHEITNQFIFGTNQNDVIKDAVALLDDNVKTRVYSLAGDDNIKIVGGSAYIEAGSGNDTIDLRSSKGENTVYGGVNNGKDNDDDGDDTIYAGQGKDTIYGGNGKDTIYTDNDDKEDLLYGGDGFDTYYVGDKDIIFDSDGKGKVVFDGVELKEGTYDKNKGAYVSKDGLIEYRLNESKGKSTLTVQKGGKSIAINEFSKEDKSLGIKLANSKIEVSVTNKEGSANWLKESLGDRGLPFTLSLNRKLDKGEYLKVEVVTSMKGDKSIIEFKEGEGDISKDFNFTWKDDNYPQGNRSFVVNACVVDESSDITAEVISSARGTIKDDDRDPDNPNNPNYPNNPDVPTDPNDPENAPVRYDPIIIDLNKDGTTTSKLNGAVNFDMDNNGFKEATGWISKDDAFLAYDRNGNGKIDNGSELFGDKTVSVGAYGYTGKTAENGFEALKEFDSNSDNVIDEKDKDFDKLLLWQDLNTNGLTEEGELKTLKEHNIKSIDLRYKETQIDNNGNLIKQTSTVTFNDNTTTTADDVWFKVDLRYTEQPSINIPERIKALPEVTAFGNLHNLRNAMSENSGLENMIKDYISLTPEEKAKQLDSILFKWAGVEGNACIKASLNRHYG